jgi:hypothetical protein
LAVNEAGVVQMALSIWSIWRIKRRCLSAIGKSCLSARISKAIDTGQHARWINAENVGKTEEEMIAIWNELRLDDLIEE